MRTGDPQALGDDIAVMWVGAPLKLQPSAPGPLSGHSMTMMDGSAVVFGGEPAELLLSL